jgi:mRNA interferase RelE/StbE
VTEYRTVLHPAAREELRAIDRSPALRILAKLAELEADPFGLDTTALTSAPERRWLRVGNFRVTYTIEHSALIVWVVQVGHRSSIYRT